MDFRQSKLLCFDSKLIEVDPINNELTLFQVSVNGLVSSSKKSLHERVLINIYDGIWCHYATMNWPFVGN